MKELFKSIIDRFAILINDHFLQPSTFIGLTTFYFQWKHPELVNDWTMLTGGWLVSKKG